MMQFIRDRVQGLVAGAIILLLCLTFLLWGIESYISAARQVVVAKINGEEIKLQEFQSAFQRMRQRAQAEQGTGFNPDFWAEETTKRRALDVLVEERLLRQVASDARLRISNPQLTEYFRGAEAFQQDGKFSQERFQQIAQSMGLTSAGLEAQARNDLTVQQLRAGIALSAFSTRSEAVELAQLLEQRRDVGYATIQPAKPDTVSVTDAELEAWFKEHAEDFRIPEKVDLEYLELKLDDLKKEVAVDDAALEAYYDTHKAQYTVQEERSVNHVLVQVKPDAPAAEVEAALTKAKALRASIAGGKSIEDVAKASSDDIGSRADGGATGFFPKGVMAPEFEAAAFAMQKGDLSEPVKTQFGFHVIKLKDIRPGGTKPFAEARPDVEAAYRTEQAEAAFFERAEKFSDAVNEHPDSLVAAGEKVHLKAGTASRLTRADIDAKFSSGLTTALWAPEVLKESLATMPVEIGSNRMVAGRVTHYEASRLPSLADVKDDVLARVRDLRVRDAAKARGDAVLARLKKGEDPRAVVEAEQLQWTEVKAANRDSGELNRAVARAAFREPLDKPDAVGVLGVQLGTGAYVVARVSNLVLPKPESVEGRKLDVIKTDMDRVRVIGAWREFVETLRADGSIKIWNQHL